MRTRIPLALAMALAIGLGLRLLVVQRPVDPGEGERPRPAGSEDRSTRSVEVAEPSGGGGEAAPSETPLTLVSPILVAGRVVDERLLPVVGAAVEVWDRGRSRATTSGEDGGFRVAVEASLRGVTRTLSLVARDGVRSAIRPTWVLDADVDAGLLVLGPSLEVIVSVVDAGDPVAGARVAVSHRHPGWVTAPVSMMERATDRDGRAAFRLPPGYAVFLASFEGRRGRVGAALPRDGAGPHRIDLGPTRTVDIVVVERGTGAPVAGARVEALAREQWATMSLPHLYDPPIEIAPTDEEGRTMISGVFEDETLALRVEADGYPPPRSSPTFWIPARVTSKRVELQPPVTYRWRVVPGESPVPPDGATIRLWPFTNSGLLDIPESGRMEGPDLIVEGFGEYAAAYAVAPDGSITRLHGGVDYDSPEVSFRPPRTIDVLIRDSAREPVAGVAVSILDQGGNRIVDPVETGAEGRARFEGLHGGLVSLSVASGRARALAHTTVDLEAGSASLVIDLGARVEVVARVTIDGRPALPASYSVNGPYLSLEGDAERGELRVATYARAHAETVAFTLHASGFEDATIVAPAANPVAEVALVRAGSLGVDVVGWVLSVQPSLERWAPEESTWKPHPSSWAGPDGPDGLLYRNLPAGRYRVVDRRSRAVSGEADVVPGAEPARVTLEVVPMVLIAGRVDLPAGADASLARVVVGDEASETPRQSAGHPVAADGRFAFRTAGDRPVKLAVAHPLLTADPSLPNVIVTGPADGVVLRLVPAAVGAVTFDPAPRVQPFASLRVLFFRGEPAGEPVAARELVPDGEAFRFGGVARGTYTLWFDVPGFAPNVVPGVELGEGVASLGRVMLRRGASIRVTILAGEGASPPRVALFARALDEPVYRRGLNSSGEREVVLAGLGPGRFEVSGFAMGAAWRLSPRTVTLGADDEVRITADLR